MKRIVLLAALVMLLVPIMSACQQQPTLDEAKTDFCDKLEAFGTALDELGQTSGTTTIEEFNTAKENAVTAWTDLQTASQTLEEVQLAETQTAFDELQATFQGITDDMTLAGAFATVVTEAQETRALVETINTTVCVVGGATE